MASFPRSTPQLFFTPCQKLEYSLTHKEQLQAEKNIFMLHGTALASKAPKGWSIRQNTTQRYGIAVNESIDSYRKLLVYCEGPKELLQAFVIHGVEQG